ncbi:AAA family ATPase [Aerosakkonema sp. BLCC-F183]|uniref:ATP-binding protein n=1 Tax=Aerosakkonema sp. BLCC-F183 TaxID=3342834 RepID=UPI0035BABC89
MNLTGYQLKTELYKGYRTIVYRGEREVDRLPVAIKFLKNPYPNFSELVQFRNQYTIAKNLNYPQIIQTYSLENYQHSYALVMEDFGGVALSNYFKLQSKLPGQLLPEFLSIALVLCDALDLLYRERVIHKDIKPSNILINPQTKEVKLIDFSIASLLPRETQTLLNPNVLEGTLAYISPEQTGRMNRGIDYRTDFYSLGITFYELLTGELPFQWNDPMELVHCHIAKRPKLVNEINPEIPAVLSEIVSKLMAKNAEDRYQSALGLKWDLEQCWQQLQTKGHIEAFPIAQRDLCDRFIVPDQLYGRDREVQSLLEAFERVSRGATEMMLVAGFSGIGKTAVVNEVHKPIVRQRGYFIKGKFDQFQRNIPFSAFVQAFRYLMGELLTESDVRIQEWKHKILEAFGENGQVLIDVIPELEKIIGPQPPALELSGTAAENRFNLLFQNFIQVFTTADHPLVIFLDDLQWADSASLQLMKVLMNDNGYLLMLGAYRDNEVSPAHPFILTVEELKKAGANVHTITLNPLAVEHTNHLIADTLHCSPELALPLTQLVDRKTKGNPFFTTQFLKALHEDGYITFNGDRRYWECDITQINALALTDDVVEFMALQLQKLPEKTQQVLKLAACVGNQFDLATLAIISEQSLTETATALWKALQEGFILPNTQLYKFFQSEESKQFDRQKQANPAYRFLHDRVQQAAYSLIDPARKQLTHLTIGQLLQTKLSAAEQEEKLFDIVGHLNLGRELLTDRAERQALAQGNLDAAQKAKSATAYVAARNFVQTGLSLLTSHSWQDRYDLSLQLHVLAAEVAYLVGDFEDMERQSQLVLDAAKTVLDKVEIYAIQINARSAQNQMAEAISVGSNALAQLGIEFSPEANQATTEKTLQDLALQLENLVIEDLVQLPIMTDPHIIAAMKLMAILFVPIKVLTPVLLPLLCAKMVGLSLQFGNSSVSAMGYLNYGLVLINFGDVEQGYRFGKVALDLLDRFHSSENRAMVLLFFGALIQHRKQSLQSTVPLLKEGYLLHIETGGLLYAGYSINNYLYNQFFSGFCLADLEIESKKYVAVMTQMKQDNPLIYTKIKQQTIDNLIVTKQHPDLLIGDVYDETVIFPQYIRDNELMALAWACICKLMLAYLFGYYDRGLTYIDTAYPYLGSIAGFFQIPIFYFYAGLTYLTIAATESNSERSHALTLAEQQQAALSEWARSAPMNHQHKVDLLEAEKCRVLGKRYEAGDFYDRAIAGAKNNGFVQEEALANELAARFYLDWGKEKVAAGYMQEAYYCYARWGAKAKVNDLEQRYPQLLSPILQPATQRFTTLEALASISSVTYSSSEAKNSTSTSINAMLDLAAVIRASQSLASAIQLDELLQQLTQIILQYSGGDRCALLVPDVDGEWQVRAIATPESTELCTQPIEGNSQLPIKRLVQICTKELKARC